MGDDAEQHGPAAHDRDRVVTGPLFLEDETRPAIAL